MSTRSNDSEFIRPGEAANMLGVTTRTLANWADAGRLPFIRFGDGERRYRRADVEALATPPNG